MAFVTDSNRPNRFGNLLKPSHTASHDEAARWRTMVVVVVVVVGGWVGRWGWVHNWHPPGVARRGRFGVPAPWP